MKIIELDTVDSTNNYAKSFFCGKEECLISANIQTAGRGNANNSWHSEYKKNILVSFVLFPEIEIKKFFQISILVSLAVVDYLKSKNIFAMIKWPNDIYVGDKKIAGLLIENTLGDTFVTKSIIGIGLNVNQSVFPASLPNPISIKKIIDKESNLSDEVFSLTEFIFKKFKEKSSYDEDKKLYLEKLYRFQCFSHFIVDGDNIFGKIIDVDDFGFLILESEKGEIRKFAHKEIKFI